MKRKLTTKLFALASMAFLASSCSHDEMVENVRQETDARQPIEFHLDMMSRSEDKTINTLDTIWVYADDGSETVFEATPFIKDQYGNFKPDEKIYWPDDIDNINFTAFWPSPDVINTCYNTLTEKDYNGTSNQIILNPGMASVKCEPCSHVGYHYDLITAKTSTNRNSANSGIALTFSHAFAQLEFKAKIDESADYTVVVHSMFLAYAQRSGTYSIDQKKWTKDNRLLNLFTAPQNITTLSSTPISLTEKTGPIYTVPAKMATAKFGDKSTKANKLYLCVYGKVYRDGKLILPDDSWSDDVKQARINTVYANGFINSLMNFSGCVSFRIPLGDDIEYLAGNKYIYTIDFTNGLGYWANSDPIAPDQPILSNPIVAKVTVENWDSSEINKDAN